MNAHLQSIRAERKVCGVRCGVPSISISVCSWLALVLLAKHRSAVPMRTTPSMKAYRCSTKGVFLMATKLSQCCSLSRYALILVSFLTLAGVLSGCGASSVAGPSGHPSELTNTSTPTHALKGTIREISLPAHFSPTDLTTGPDGNRWLAGSQIGRVTPTGLIREFSLPADSVAFRITTGPDGNLWFLQADKVGRIHLPEYSVSSRSPLVSWIPTRVVRILCVAT